MDYGYATTSYGAQGGADGGGFMAGSQNESPSAKRSYGKDTLRPVTIKQLNEAHHPNADADYFMIDGSETTQVTFVGQIRNISVQTTNVTYKLDDGTGHIEVKEWVDQDAMNNPDDPASQKPKLTDQAYARVYGRLKEFGTRRHVGANIIRPIQDYNEIQYHLLEATAVHLHFSRGPLDAGGQANGGANGMTNGAPQQNDASNSALPAGLSRAGKIVYEYLRTSEQTNEGLNVEQIAMATNLQVGEAQAAGDELTNYGLAYTTMDESTWAVMM